MSNQRNIRHVLHQQARALETMPARLRLAANRDGRSGFEAELRRQTREMASMARAIEEKATC